MTGAQLGADAARRLFTRHRHVAPGLTGAEFDRVEERYGITFADDHRAFLGAGLPLGNDRWPDWRDGDPSDLRAKLAWPVEGVLFDVEKWYWHRDWGERPARTAAAVELAREHLTKVPQLIPVYSHRYLPPGRGTSGHPVLSVYQTDIICYGTDLLDYVYQEFGAGPGIDRTDPAWQPTATVPFWRDFLQ
ncbi:hypothetical protein AB0H83_21835 [Dactylosporangium sp. NPDC050688]|uniref:hypothetical protein n=1 Tax=Dactylosporangium sp. NPDC050688 TaxID=3157217 RepID=UPI0033D95266